MLGVGIASRNLTNEGKVSMNVHNYEFYCVTWIQDYYTAVHVQINYKYVSKL